MPKCGSQVTICDLPIRFDTYKGCTHDCKYCFVRRNNAQLLSVTKDESAESLRKFINGKRTSNTNWCDWNIPIHWGGMSDPFQPAEKKFGYSLEALKVFEETQYPVIISTKGRLCIEEPYLSILSRCNVIMQISAVGNSYNQLEEGAPPFEERLNMIRVLSKNVKRVNVRIQPYMHECFDEIMLNVKRFAEAGAYGLIFEGMKFLKKQKGLIKIGGDWCYPENVLRNDFIRLRDECHKYGLKFYCGENRLRSMGDSLTCCGCDGIEGFVANTFNCNHLLLGDKVTPTERMLEIGTANVFGRIQQTTIRGHELKTSNFAKEILKECKSSTTRESLGKYES